MNVSLAIKGERLFGCDRRGIGLLQGSHRLACSGSGVTVTTVTFGSQDRGGSTGTHFLVYPIDGTDLGISADEFETAGKARWPGCEVVRTPAGNDDGIEVTLQVRDLQDGYGFQIFHGCKGDRISTEARCEQSIRVAFWVAGLTDEPVALLDLNNGIATTVPRGGTMEDVESGWTSDNPGPRNGTT